MTLGSFAADALTDLTVADLDRMLELDETLFVEHKFGIESGEGFGLAKAVASFANTIGGWLLVGVKDGEPVGSEEGWARAEAPTLVDAVRDRLRGEIDPLPAFEARVLEHARGPVGVIRVYESADTPHISVRTGAIFVREVAGVDTVNLPRRPGAGLRGERAYAAAQIRSRTQLLELAERGRLAAARVNGLLDPLRPLPLISERLGPNFEPLASGGVQPVPMSRPQIIVRLLPLTVGPRLRGWATTASASAATLGVAEFLSMKRGLDNGWAEPDPSGVAVAVPLDPGAIHQDSVGMTLGAIARVVFDGAGIAGASLELEPPSDEGRRRRIRLSALAGDLIHPVVVAAAKLLTDGEFLGRARGQIDLIGIGRALLLEEGGREGVGRPWIPSAGDLILPVDSQQTEALALRSANAYGRSAGIQAWD